MERAHRDRRKPQPMNGDSVFRIELPQPRRFEPPKGIDAQPFERKGLYRMTFIFKVPEGNLESIDPTTLQLCVEAALDAARLIEMPDEIDTLMDGNEYKEYVDKYTTAVVDMIISLIDEHQDKVVVACAAPVGGLAPLQGVMKKFIDTTADRPELRSKVSFTPFAKEQDVYEKIQAASAVVLVDDGLARFSTQIEPLFAVMPSDDVDEMLRAVRHRIAEVGDINDPSLLPLYTQIMKRLADFNMVAAPLFSKNNLFETAVDRVAAKLPDSPAVHAQQAFFENFPLEIIDQDRVYPGGVIEGVPCRDIGVTIGQIRPFLSADARQRLESAGIDESATFRLLANRPDVLDMTEEQSFAIAEMFARILNQKLSK